MLCGKKILYIITKSVWGGAQKYVYDLATNLPKDRFEAIVATGGNGLLIKKLEEQNIRVIRIPKVTKNINFLQELKSLFYLYKIFVREKPDVIHLNSSKLGGLGATTAFFYKITSNQLPVIIFTAHGWPFNEDRNFMARGIIYFLSWLTAFFADRVINITKTDYRQSLKFPLLSPNKFIYIPNGLKLNDRLFLPPAEARKILGINKENFIIGAITELTKNKGLGYLIDAINQIRIKNQKTKIKIIIIGKGEEQSKLKTQIKSLGLEHTIFLAGFKENAEKYLKGFDVFVMPSVKEGLPYALMEAMAAGLPIIASRVGGIPDLIEHEKNGLLVEPKDNLDLAQKLEKIIQKPENFKMLGLEAQKTIGTKFLFRDMLQKTIALYESR